MREKLTLKEIEDLCDLYIEGVLSPQEEHDLATVISLLDYKSPKIEETLFLMGLSRIVARNDAESSSQDSSKIESTKKYNTVSLRKALFKILKTSAAAVILILLVGTFWNAVSGLNRSEDTVYEVYIDGKLVTDPQECMNLALKAFRESERQINDIQNNEKLALAQVRESLDNVESLCSEMNQNLGK